MEWVNGALLCCLTFEDHTISIQWSLHLIWPENVVLKLKVVLKMEGCVVSQIYGRCQ